MLNLESLREFTNKWQTSIQNVVRVYIQHLFLAHLYKLDHAEKLLFKGGTALRIIYQSPRFSEDLDFTGCNIGQVREIDELFIETLAAMEKMGIPISFQDAKATTGGYLGIIVYTLFGIAERMKFEISLRRSKTVAETTTIINEYTPPYTLTGLSAGEIVQGKMDALINRRKPRDYYDLYFFLRHPRLRKYVDTKRLSIILTNLEKEKVNFKIALAPFLPKSHQMILRDFKAMLQKEIETYR